MVGGWQAVDAAQDPLAFTGYLERVSEHPNVRERSRARLAAAGLQPGATVLDLGCGIGSNTLMLAEFVGPGGRVHAVDHSRTMIEITARRAREHGLAISCRQGDAAALRFPNRSLDVVWMERVLLHVASPPAVVAEILRVLRPEGQLVAMEPDSAATTFFDGDDAELARLMERSWIAGIAHPLIGKTLEELARVIGFTRVRVEPQTIELRDFDLAATVTRWPDQLRLLLAAGRITKARAEAWLRNVQARAQEGQVICSLRYVDLFARP